jgi:hypothetical protein
MRDVGGKELDIILELHAYAERTQPIQIGQKLETLTSTI